MKKINIGMAVILAVAVIGFIFTRIAYTFFSVNFGSISMLITSWFCVCLGYSVIGYLTVFISKNLKYGLIAGLTGLALFQILLGIGIIVDLLSSDAWKGLVTVLIGVYLEPPMIVLAIISIVFLVRIKNGKTPEKLQ